MTTKTPITPNTNLLALSDDVIAIIRDLVQLSILTGTNVIDHLRGIRVSVDEAPPGFLVPSEEYVVAYNKMLAKLEKQAEEAAEAQKKTLAV